MPNPKPPLSHSAWSAQSKFVVTTSALTPPAAGSL